MLKKLFHSGIYPNNVNLALLVLRISSGVLMLTHGVSKISLFEAEPIEFYDPIGLGAVISLTLTIFAEVLCAIFLILGIGTRFAAVTLLITMLVVALLFHANNPFAKQELPLLYATTYLVLVFTGAGKFSIDFWLFNRAKKN
jgi:putative oxidoreductase